MKDEGKIESIIDNISITEEIEEAVQVFMDDITQHSIPRRAAFFACIDILMHYANQKNWDLKTLKSAIERYLDLHSLEKDRQYENKTGTSKSD